MCQGCRCIPSEMQLRMSFKDQNRNRKSGDRLRALSLAYSTLEKVVSWTSADPTPPGGEGPSTTKSACPMTKPVRGPSPHLLAPIGASLETTTGNQPKETSEPAGKSDLGREASHREGKHDRQEARSSCHGGRGPGSRWGERTALFKCC